MNFLKRHKLATFFIVLYIAFIIVGYFLYSKYNEKAGAPVYGDRLDGIENVKITDEQKTNLVNKIMDVKEVLKVSEPHLSGRTYNVVITYSDKGGNQSEARKLANYVTESLTEDQNNYYDIQVFIKKPYNCNIEAVGKADEEGNFVGDVKVKFVNDLANDKLVLGYGLSLTDKKDYNAKTQIDITSDGEYIIYGYTKDKIGESTCSLKVVRKTSKDVATKAYTINSLTSSSFPLIGYKRKGNSNYVWTKER